MVRKAVVGHHSSRYHRVQDPRLWRLSPKLSLAPSSDISAPQLPLLKDNYILFWTVAKPSRDGVYKALGSVLVYENIFGDDECLLFCIMHTWLLSNSWGATQACPPSAPHCPQLSSPM